MKININPGTRRMLCLVSAIVAGCIFPFLFPSTQDFFSVEQVAGTINAGTLVPYFVMTMLFLAFIDVKFSRETFAWSHLAILAFMVAFSVVMFGAVKLVTGNFNYAVMAFLMAMTPTANAAPVITALLGRRADYATVSVVLSNLFVAVALAPLVHLVIGNEYEIETFDLAKSAILVVGTPFLLSMFLRNFWDAGMRFARKYKFLSFYIWMIMLFNCCAQSSAYIARQEGINFGQIAGIFALAAVMCAVHFVCGYFMGEKRFRRECSQSLGQKNTMLMLWVGLAFFNPIVALGPTFYVICHNIWNSIQLKRYVPAKTADTEK